MTVELRDEVGRLLGAGGRPFTPEQAIAIQRREGPLLVAANAGSGKTSVLVERFVRSVIEDEVSPGAILAITFTDKAAGELRERIRERFVELGRRDLAQEAEGAWVSTIHGFCARVLRAHAVPAGLDPAFTVLDDASVRELRVAAFEAALAGLLNGGEAPRPEALDLVAAWTPDRLERAVTHLHDTLRSAGESSPSLPDPPPAPDPSAAADQLRGACAEATADLAAEADAPRVNAARGALDRCAAVLARDHPTAAQLGDLAPKAGNVGALKRDPYQRYRAAHEQLLAVLADQAARPQLALVDELLGRFSEAYEKGKRAVAALDYEDLQLHVRDLFDRAPAVGAAYAERFARIMVDEFQDTNRLQIQLIERLDRDNVFVVGDELQSIYGFRHAAVEVFRTRHAELDRRDAAVALATNFRSRGQLLAAINDRLGALHERFERLVPGRDEQGGGAARVELLITDIPSKDSDAEWPDDDPLPARHAWRRAEARLVARRVAELVAAGEHAPGDIVVLLRAAGDMNTYERALEDAGLATLASGGRGFWARQQVQDLCSYLAALVNPRDEGALLGVLASPLGAGASPDALALLALAARAGGRSLWEQLAREPAETWAAALSADERERLERFAAMFADERKRAPLLGLDALLERAVARTAYDEHVLRLPGGPRRLANVNKLIRLAGAYEADRGRDVRGLVDRALGELEAEAREPDAPIELAGLQAVRLMTIHAAKGLEFPVVIVADLGRERPGQPPDVLVDPVGRRVGIRVVPMHGRSRPALAYDELKEERTAADRAEERRVFHVAVTRAQERLILSGGVCTEKWPRTTDTCAPIVWLAPALAPTLLSDDSVRVHVQRPGDPAPDPVVLPRPIGHDVAAALAEPAPLPASPPPLPVGTLSYSSLSRHAECGYRFYLERVLGLPPQDPPWGATPPSASPPPAPVAGSGIDLLLRGTLAHELLEHVDLADPRVPDEAAVRERAARHDVELSDAEVADLQALVSAALGGDLMARVRVAPAVHREHGFALALGGDHHSAPLLTGFVDVLAIETDGAALVVDYKTDHLGDADPEIVVERSYGTQRRIYALAALRAHAPYVEVAHLFLERPAEPAVARYEAADVDRLEAEVAVLASGVLEAHFEVAAHPHRELCATCPGRGGLCSWPEEVVLLPLGAAEGEG